jgi:capsule polysaccharide export protein KpsE/RkpR
MIKKNPRPKLYTKQALVRTTEKEIAELHDRARKTKLSLSRYLVKSGLSDGQVLTAEEKEEIRQLRFELRKIGTNLNQIALAFNASMRGRGDEPTTKALKETQQKINDALGTLLQFIK